MPTNSRPLRREGNGFVRTRARTKKLCMSIIGTSLYTKLYWERFCCKKFLKTSSCILPINLGIMTLMFCPSNWWGAYWIIFVTLLLQCFMIPIFYLCADIIIIALTLLSPYFYFSTSSVWQICPSPRLRLSIIYW